MDHHAKRLRQDLIDINGSIRSDSVQMFVGLMFKSLSSHANVILPVLKWEVAVRES